MDKILLAAKPRTEHGKKAAALRQAGQVPAVAYGHGIQAQSLVVDGREVEQVYSRAGGNKIVALKIGDATPKNVLIHDVQLDGVRGGLTHLDFYVVRMDEEIRTEKPLHFVGESTAVYQDEGTLLKNLEAVEVACLPGDLPESLEVDISILDDFEKVITVADLKVPKGVAILEEPELMVAKVEPPRSEEEIAELESELGDAVPESAKEEAPTVVAEENEGDKDRGRDKK